MPESYDAPQHGKFMRRCLQLAKRGGVNAMPNPLVGAVVVHNNRIIGEGWHKVYGKPHAEPNAIGSVPSHLRHLLPQSVLYVNLEPCNHYGKTPPCTQTILKNGIKMVVVGCTDPNPKVSGAGIATLRKAGVEVVAGVEEAASRQLNRRFFTWITRKRPYVLLKWAQTPNGFFAPGNGWQRWISNKLSQRLTHRFRAREQAILVGTNTARIDNPKLNIRFWHGRQPLRLVVDKTGKLPENLHLFDGGTPTVVFSQQATPKMRNVTNVELDFGGNVPAQILHYLYQHDIQSVMVEGGAALLNAFIENNLWDEACVYVGAEAWESGMTAPGLVQAHLAQTAPLGNNLMNIYLNRHTVALLGGQTA